MPLQEDPAEGVVIAEQSLQAWTASLIQRAGTPPELAADVAEVLVASDLRGIASHGVARLEQYLKLVQAGVLDPAARAVKEKSRPALARFNANNGWGQPAGRVATDDAIERARELGAAISVVRNSNHYGIAGWYAMRIAEQGLIGVSLTNAGAMVAPTRSRVRMLGTNPIAVAAPAGRFGMVVLDMATSTVARGKIEIAERQGRSIPEGWAIDREGSPTLKPEDALAGALMPLGGGEETGGYKGYGLALIVEILTGVLASATCGHHIMGLFSTEGNSDLGHFFMAIDPDAIEVDGSFEARLETMIAELTSAPTAVNAPGPVLYPGRLEADRAAYQAEHGIALEQAVFESLQRLAEQYSVALPSTKPLAQDRSADAHDAGPSSGQTRAKTKQNATAEPELVEVRYSPAQRRAIAFAMPELSSKLSLDTVKEKYVVLTVQETRDLVQAIERAVERDSAPQFRRQFDLVLSVYEFRLNRMAQAAAERAERPPIVLPPGPLVYQFKLTLREIVPAIWRRILVKNSDLDRFHERIQLAMGWTNSHLHEFRINDFRYVDPWLMDEMEPGDLSTRETKLSDIIRSGSPKPEIEYTYDFGDSWVHTIDLEEVQTARKGQKYPVCLAGERACPPEDVGGVWGFSEYCKIMRKGKGPQYREYLEWNGPFNPDAFDAAATTRKMQRGLPDWRLDLEP